MILRCACVAVCCSVLQFVEVCRSVLQCVAGCCSVLLGDNLEPDEEDEHVTEVCECCSALQSVAVSCSVLQRLAVCNWERISSLRRRMRVKLGCAYGGGCGWGGGVV